MPKKAQIDKTMTDTKNKHGAFPAFATLIGKSQTNVVICWTTQRHIYIYVYLYIYPWNEWCTYMYEYVQ